MKISKTKTKRHMWQLLEQGECIDTSTDEVNCTGLCERTVDDLELDDSILDDPDHEIWDWTVEVAEAWDRAKGSK